MKKAIVLATALLAAASFAKGGGHGGAHSSGSGHSSGTSTSSSGSGASHSVRGHYTKDGTYVQPYHATNPDNTKVNNWSSKPNVNPYTGKEGTRDPSKP